MTLNWNSWWMQWGEGVKGVMMQDAMVPYNGRLPFVVGKSVAHLNLLEKIRRFAEVDAEVLVSGPTGVGKEVYARVLHAQSARAKGAFVPMDCGAIPNELFENELFGHTRGAFTGAIAQASGLVAAAEGGVLFFDEVDALSPASQVKLLRFVQRKEYRRLGEPRLRSANVRVLAATNTDLEQAVQEGLFREDLYYRLRVIPIAVPPLKERREDVPLLLEAFGKYYAECYGGPRIEFSPAALRYLEEYSWPGNVRELENCVRYLTCLRIPRPVEVCDLDLLSADKPGADSSLHRLTMQDAKRQLVMKFERAYLEEKLLSAGGNIARAANASGKDRRAFFELMRKHGLRSASSRPVEGKSSGAQHQAKAAS